MSDSSSQQYEFRLQVAKKIDRRSCAVPWGELPLLLAFCASLGVLPGLPSAGAIVYPANSDVDAPVDFKVFDCFFVALTHAALPKIVNTLNPDKWMSNVAYIYIHQSSTNMKCS